MEEALNSFIKLTNDDSVVHISEVSQNEGGYSQPFSTGYSVFDNSMKGGIRAGNLIIITGISGMGKSTFAECISVNLSKNNFPSLWFSYEIPLMDLAARFKEMGALDKNFLIYTPKRNTSGNLKWVEQKIREGLEKFKTKFVFIDHVEYLSPSNVRSSDQYRMILGNVCRELKSLAIELEVIIFLMAHVKKVENKEIQMQDISESSDIYKLADFVFSISRQTEIKMENNKRVEVMENRSVIRMLKNRLTGDLRKLDVVLENNMFVPLTEEKKEQRKINDILL